MAALALLPVRLPPRAAARPGSGGISAVKLGSKKNGKENRSRPLTLRTRCGVDRYQPPVSRSSMSPMLATKVPSIGGASTQPAGVLTCRPPLASWASRVSRP